MPQKQGDTIVATETEARAGVTGQHMRYVLAGGIIGCVLLFAAVYIFFFT
jgi:hypothetical protein